MINLELGHEGEFCWVKGIWKDVEMCWKIHFCMKALMREASESVLLEESWRPFIYVLGRSVNLFLNG